MRRTPRLTVVIILIGALILTGVGVQAGPAQRRARDVLLTYMLAVQHNDIPTFVRLAEPNMRALIERNELGKQDTATFIDFIAGSPVRVIESSKGVVYFGWEREPRPCHGGCGWNLMALVVGEGRSICRYSELADRPRSTDTTSWQVSALPGEESWRLAYVRNEAAEAAINAKLAAVDEQLLIAWYFEGSIDARRAIERQMGTHNY